MLILLSAVSWHYETISKAVFSKVLLLRPTKHKGIKSPTILGTFTHSCSKSLNRLWQKCAQIWLRKVHYRENTNTTNWDNFIWWTPNVQKKRKTQSTLLCKADKTRGKLNVAIAQLDLIFCFVRSRIKLPSCNIAFRTSHGSQGYHLKQHFRSVKWNFFTWLIHVLHFMGNSCEANSPPSQQCCWCFPDLFEILGLVLHEWGQCNSDTWGETHSTGLHVTFTAEKRWEKTQRGKGWTPQSTETAENGIREQRSTIGRPGWDRNMGFNADYKGNPHSKLNSIYITIYAHSSRRLCNLDKDLKLNDDSATQITDLLATHTVNSNHECVWVGVHFPVFSSHCSYRTQWQVTQYQTLTLVSGPDS